MLLSRHSNEPLLCNPGLRPILFYLYQIMDILTLDTETYYSTDFSLSKMQTDAYIKDDRFETIGVSVAVNDIPPVWFSGTEEETLDWLHQYNWSNSAVRCHNTMFDGFILSYRYGIRPKLWMDTLGQGRMLRPYLASHSLAKLAKHFGLPDKGTEVINALGKRRADFSPRELEAYGDYCKHDTWLCRELGRRMDAFTPPLYARLIDMTVRMFTEPVLVGKQDLMQELYTNEVARKDALMALADVARDTIMSNDKFAAALENLGVTPPTKVSPTTGKFTWAFAKTDEAFTDLQEHDDSEVQALVAARLGTKTTIAETRALKFLEMSRRGPLPVYLNFWGAKVTGRYSGGNSANYQNLPARGPSAGLRMAIEAPEGHSIIVGDSSNIELRTNMALAGQHDVLDKIRNGVDLYCDFASTLSGRIVTKRDKPERLLGKLACIAEGQLVLTDSGLVPIEQIKLQHRVWDGVEFVSTDGVIYKGERDVIEYDGLTATPDHEVCLGNGTWRQLKDAADKAESIATTGRGGEAIRFLGGCERGDKGRQTHQRPMSMWHSGADCGTSARGGQGQAQELEGHRGAPSRARVYDIVNAGPRHRFTVSDKLVSNCLGLGYGAGAAGFVEMVRIARRNDPTIPQVDLSRAHEIVRVYRSVHHKVVDQWKYFEEVVLPDIAAGCDMIRVDVNGWFVTQNDGFGRPGEPGVMYNDLKWDGKEWTYQAGRNRSRIFGPKGVENLSQHMAMCVVMWQTARINERYPVKLSVHDEAVIVVPDADVPAARAYMEECLAMAPQWCRAILPVACETGVGKSYGNAKS